MAQLPSPPPQTGRGRRLAKLLLGGLAFVLALAVGLALFLPWDLIWARTLQRAAADNPRLNLSWASLEEPSALGFTLRGAKAEIAGRATAEAESLRLRLGSTPLALANLTVHAGGRTVHLDEVRLEVGFSPLAVLHLAAGEELTLSLIRNRTVVVSGKTDLAQLLPGSRLDGALGIYADLTWKDWRHYPARGTAEITAPSLTLPDGRLVAGLTASASLEDSLLTLNDLRMRQPVPLRGRGNATLSWGNLLASGFEFTGQAFPGLLDQEIHRQGRLYEIFHP